MAFADFDRLTSITREKVMPAVVHQLKKEMPTFGHFLKKAKMNSAGGSHIDVPVTYQFKTQGGAYSGLSVLNTAQESTRTRARYDWRQVYEPIVIDNMELFKNGASKNEEVTVVDLLAQEMEEAKESIKNNLSTMIYGDGSLGSWGALPILGLKALVDDGTDVASLGDITLASYAWWQANVATSVGSLTLSHMATQFTDASSGTDSVNVIFTTETLLNAYEALHTPAARYVFSGDKAPKVDTLASNAMYFRGAELIADEYCNSGEMYFLNDKYIELQVGKHPKHPTDKSGFTVTPMREPSDQDGQVAFILFYGQMVAKRPSRTSKSQGLTA